MTRTRALRITLIVIAVSQFALGVAFLVLPAAAEKLLGLTPAAPAWANWLIVMLGVRFLGYGAGMLAAARDPGRHRAWINTMIGIQAVDWMATFFYVMTDRLTLANVGTAAFLPLLFIAALLVWYPRRSLAGHA